MPLQLLCERMHMAVVHTLDPITSPRMLLLLLLLLCCVCLQGLDD